MSFKISLDGANHNVEIVARRPNLRLRVDDHEYEISAPGDVDDGRRTIEISGNPLHFARAHDGDRQIVRMGGRTLETRLVDPRSEADASGGGQDHVRAPMPGVIVHVHRVPGAVVARGEALLTIESMKLQMTLLAPRDGLLARLPRSVGDAFDKDDIVAELAPIADRD